jgi:hypothetical protein
MRNQAAAIAARNSRLSILLATDALVAGVALWMISGFVFVEVTSLREGFRIIAMFLGGQWLVGQYGHDSKRSLKIQIVRGLAGIALAAVAARYLAKTLGVDPNVITAFFVALAPIQGLIRFFGSNPKKRSALLRWALLAGSVTYLFSPYTARSVPGGGDGYWYTLMIGDFVTQWRAGIFPVFVGQSIYAFNGAVLPHRLAPLLQHSAGLLDLLTGQQLTFATLLDIILFLAGSFGAISAWLCVKRVLPDAPWTSLALALLYISSPGVLALFYTGGMYMSVMTLPFVPWIALGIWRASKIESSFPTRALVFPLAATWYCHPPIALWLSAGGTVAMAVRWLGLRQTPRRILREAISGVGLFVILTCFCFTSILTLGASAGTQNWDISYRAIAMAFPAILLPVSQLADQTSDYQLGAGLWMLLLATGGSWFYRRNPGTGFLVLMATALVVLLLPIPFISKFVWSLLPNPFVIAAYKWPMQRLGIVLSGVVVIIGATRWRTIFIPGKTIGTLARCLLWIGVAWSGIEAAKFLHRGSSALDLPARAELTLAPNNAVLTRYAFFHFPAVPSYYSHGYVDPVLVHRVTSIDESQEILSNEATARELPGRVISVFGKTDGGSAVVLEPKLVLDPELRHYLTFQWLGPSWEGSLSVTGTTANRTYWLPDSGAGMTYATSNRSFGRLEGSSTGFSLWITGNKPESFELRLNLLEKPRTPIPLTFVQVTDHAYTPENLPIHIISFAPYRIELIAPTAGLLQTPRMFTDGYRAVVNGKRTEVRRSADGLLTIPLPAGKSIISVEYYGGNLLRATYWLSLFAWTSIGLFLGSRGLKRGIMKSAIVGK